MFIQKVSRLSESTVSPEEHFGVLREGLGLSLSVSHLGGHAGSSLHIVSGTALEKRRASGVQGQY